MSVAWIIAAIWFVGAFVIAVIAYPRSSIWDDDGGGPILIIGWPLVLPILLLALVLLSPLLLAGLMCGGRNK